MNHEEIYENTWKDQESEWLPYLKNDVLSSVFCYARYTKSNEELTGHGMKNILTIPSSPNNTYNSLRDEKDEPIYFYNDENLRYFVRKSRKKGRCASSTQSYNSIISDEVFCYLNTIKP